MGTSHRRVAITHPAYPWRSAPPGLSAAKERVQQVLEEAGVIFIPADDQAGPGVRLKKAG
jgi:hypothetical protein